MFAIVNLRRRAVSVRHWREDMQVIVALKGDAGGITERMHLGFFVNNSAIRSLASDPAIFLVSIIHFVLSGECYEEDRRGSLQWLLN